MSPRPTTVEEIKSFDTVIDVRSPSEFALDHIPGAINCPVLDDEERRLVGTTYVQVSAFEARKLGGAMVARRIAQHLETQFSGRPKDWRPLLYCWRGGMRSGSFVTWMRMVGWDAQQLQGGYKAWRRHVVARLSMLAPRLPLRVLCGPTGSGKTRVLEALSAQGEQVLDLEQLAAHRGSVLGSMPGLDQPTQKHFETLLLQAIDRFDLARTVWVEAESRRIGRLNLPEALLQRMRASPVIEIAATREARLAYLLRDYAWFADDPQGLAERIACLRGLQPNDRLESWRAWALARDLKPLFSELMAEHYDPLYARSQDRHFEQLPRSQRVETSDLSESGIEALARQIASIG